MFQFDGHFYPGAVCPRSSDPFYVVTYYIKWVTIDVCGLSTHLMLMCVKRRIMGGNSPYNEKKLRRKSE